MRELLGHHSQAFGVVFSTGDLNFVSRMPRRDERGRRLDVVPNTTSVGVAGASLSREPQDTVEFVEFALGQVVQRPRHPLVRWWSAHVLLDQAPGQ